MATYSDNIYVRAGSRWHQAIYQQQIDGTWTHVSSKDIYIDTIPPNELCTLYNYCVEDQS